jgi:hypothetical protein
MAEHILFIHNDVVADDQGAWEPYLQTLKQNGVFEGGSEVGDGMCVRNRGPKKAALSPSKQRSSERTVL